MTSKSLKIFKFELDVHDYVHEIYSSANFHFNPLSGVFLMLVKYYGLQSGVLS